MDDFYRTQVSLYPVNPKKRKPKVQEQKQKQFRNPWTHGKHLEAWEIKSEFH